MINKTQFFLFHQNQLKLDFFSNPKKNAHSKAKELMKEDFFWSPIDEAGPFGSDSGSDAAQGFYDWRKQNKTGSPVQYLRDLIVSWGFPFFDWNELDSEKLRAYIEAKTDVSGIEEYLPQLKEFMRNSDTNAGKDIDDKIFQDLMQQSAQNMGETYLLNIDNAIIGTGFAQFVIEGEMEKDLRTITLIAIKRQLLPLLIDRYEPDYKEIRKGMLTKMLAVIEKVNL